MKAIDLTGNRYGRLVALRPAPTADRSRGLRWMCQCDCGNVCEVLSYSLRKGITRSCGCLFRDTITKHGGQNERLYKVWSGMRGRCNNPSDHAYSYYGGKGIRICEEWDCYSSFREWALKSGYIEGLSIDRIDPEKDYCPENCRWITVSENTRRAAKKHYITVNGITKSCAEWERDLKTGRNAIAHWISRRGEEYAIKKLESYIDSSKYSGLDLSPTYKKHKYLTIDGETLAYSTWSKKCGKSHYCVAKWVEKHGEQFAIEKIRSLITGKE